MQLNQGMAWLIVTAVVFFSPQLQANSFEKLIMPGEVITGHAKYENDCNKCHEVLNTGTQKKLCLDCHKDINQDISDAKGYHGRHATASKERCKTCHVEHIGRDDDIVKLDKRIFQHQFTDFPLKGAHKSLSCVSCHKNDKKYREAPLQCVQCHEKNPHKDRLGKECDKCHSQALWTEMDFDHEKTKFKLTGKHKETDCKSCHINNKYKNTVVTCFACHGVDDVHQGRNGKDCQKCHNTSAWKKLKFDHDKQTKFKLYGRHRKVECKSCHPKNPYKVKIKKDCYSCHKKDDEHKSLYGEKCANCHAHESWRKVNFRHDRDTKYALTGKHKDAACGNCHQGHLYKQKTSAKCIDCHRLDDAHKGQSDKKCQSCHNTAGWHSKISFEHDLSEFPLIGLHAIVPCDACHASKSYKSAPVKCNSCHLPDDVHKLRLGSRCESCHNPNGWKVWVFDHDKDTHFKLDGSHKKIHCYDCHRTAAEEVVELGQSCGFCHAGDDPHANQFGSYCERCHSTDTFRKINMMR